MTQPYLSVIIPAYNEAERIPLTLVDIDRHLRQRKFSYEILVVNDGSTDETAKIVKKMMPVIKNLKLMDNDVNRGKGAVVRQGMLLASGKYRLFTDADNSTSVDQFDKMIPYFSAKGGSASGGEEGYDVVIGSRSVKGSRLDPPQPIYRQIPGKIGNLIIQFLLLPGIWDTQCGFKAFTAEAAEKIFSIMKITKWGFDIEALALAKHLGFRMKEIPVRWINDPFSHVRASAYLQVLLETCKIRWWLTTGKYEIQITKS